MNAAEFKQQFLPLHRMMYWTAWRLSGNAQEAEDMVQEAYLKLWTKRSELPKMNSPEAYCITLVRHLYMDRFRGNCLQVVDTTTEDLPLLNAENIERRLEARDLSDKVKEGILKLPEQQRLIITLKDVEDRSFDEIAHLTSLSEGNIRVLLSRARKAIREEFGKL
jgi:RNA polymerase sigma-70 factor (ECF subfamily)